MGNRLELQDPLERRREACRIKQAAYRARQSVAWKKNEAQKSVARRRQAMQVATAGLQQGADEPAHEDIMQEDVAEWQQGATVHLQQSAAVHSQHSAPVLGEQAFNWQQLAASALQSSFASRSATATPLQQASAQQQRSSGDGPPQPSATLPDFPLQPYAAQSPHLKCRPGWNFASPDKEAIVLDGIAQKLSAVLSRQFTGAGLRSLGLRAVKEARSLHRQYSLWWPGVMSSKEPIHCIPSYRWAALRLLADIPCREKLGVSQTKAALQQAAAAAVASGGSASAAATAAAVAAATAERIPGKRKRTRDGIAAAAAGDIGVDGDAEYVLDERSSKTSKHLHTQNHLLQHNTAAAAAGAGGLLAQQEGVAANPGAAAAAGHQWRLAAADGSTEEVSKSVDDVMKKLSTAINAASEVSNLWRKHPQVLRSLPASKVLTEGADLATLDSFISAATALQSELVHMISAHDAASAAAGVNGSSGAAVAAAKRKAFLAVRDAMGICVSHAVAWLQHINQRRLLDRAQAIIEVRDLYDRDGGGTAASGPGGLAGVADVKQKQGSEFGPKSPTGKAAAAAGGEAAAASQLPEVPRAQQQQQQHHHCQQQQQEDSGDLGQELIDEELELLQQEQRYYDVVAAAAQTAAAAAAQDQQQKDSGLSGRQGSAGGTVLTFLQQFMNK